MSNRKLSLLLPAGCLCFAILLGLPGAVYAPDAGQYRLLALGQRGAVPAPFSARILGPAIAGWLGRFTGLGVDTGFLVLGIVCLIALLALVAGLLWSWQAPTVIFAAIFLMPFWVDIFHDYYLPDLLHAAILAAILLCLLFGHTGLALLLLFPAYLARESTLLVAICLIFACWRRIRLQSALIGVLALLCAGLVSRHYAQGGPASVHGMSGGVYILGKLFWSFFKNVLGLPLWSNTLPECSPIWVKTIPPGYHLGAIRAIGMCQPSLWGPSRLLLAWFGIFGIGPALALALWRKMISPAVPADNHLPGELIVFRFCDRLRSHQHPDDPAARRQRRSPGRVRVALLLRRPALVSLYDLRPPRSPRRRIPSASPAHLLAGLVWLPASRPPASCSPAWRFWP